jgi:putative flippase GtrA
MVPFREFFWQVFRYAIVGATNTTIDFGVYAFLTRLVPFFETRILFANAISFTFALTWGFYWNRRWTFQRTDDPTRRYVRFFLVSLGGLGWTNLVLGFLVRQMGWYDLWAKAATIIVAFAWNFTMHRLWTFRCAPRTIENVVR